MKRFLAGVVLAFLVGSFGAQAAYAQYEGESWMTEKETTTTTTTAPEGAAVQETINVAALQPFTKEANYMSLPGYYRYLTYIDTGVWLSYDEAEVALANDPVIELETAIR